MMQKTLLATGITLLWLLSTVSVAETIVSKGRHPFPSSISLDKCFGEALLDAKKSAMSKFGLEGITSSSMEVCVETSSFANCELHQETLSYFDGGYISSFNILNKSETASGGQRECMIEIEADVQRYSQPPDPNFALSARLKGKRTKLKGDEIVVDGETNQKANLFLMAWYPNVGDDTYYKLSPNDFEKLENIDGKFAIPSSEGQSQYGFYAEPDMDLDENVQFEVLILLATKKPFDLLEIENSASLYQRLNSLGRDNWQMIKMGYNVLKN